MSAATPVRTVQEVFREFVLSVPDYQRGYAWEQNNVGDFLEDLDLLADGKVHYAGTLILDPSASAFSEIEAGSGVTFRRADVVDGQQRLATVVILLSAIARDLRLEGEIDLADGLVETFLADQTRQGQPLLKLTLNHDNLGFWESNILADKPGPDAPQIVSHRRLLAAREQIEAYLSKEKTRRQEEYLAWLERLREKIVKYLRVTLYEIDDTSEVGVIFETQNDRGRELTDLEKTKNLLLYLASKLDVPHHGLAILVNETWSKVLQALSSRDLASPDDENNLLRCHWLIFHNPRPRDWRRFETIKTEFSLRRYKENHPLLAKRLRLYLKTLSQCVEPFCDVMAPSSGAAFAVWQPDAKIHRRVVDYSDKLRRVGAVANVVPLLVACRLRADFGPSGYLEVVTHAEICAFRLRAAKARSDAGQGWLFPLARKVQRGEADLEAVLEGLRGVTRYHGSAAFVRLQLSFVEDWYRWPLLRHVLYEYELFRAGPAHPPAMTWERVEGRSLDQSIEHIYPQTPSDPYWTERFSAKDWHSMNDLGNLCLTYDNSSYRNKGFPAKKGVYGQDKPCYANSPLYQERDLCQLDDWTPETVATRHDQLLDFIWSRWEVEPVKKAQLQAAELMSDPTAEGTDDLGPSAVDATTVVEASEGPLSG